uniref:Uncharacterized protein n=1 Tax=Caenorhabditis japonica TaxID=281687 RepID=A0A8R1HY97_CAEJA
MDDYDDHDESTALSELELEDLVTTKFMIDADQEKKTVVQNENAARLSIDELEFARSVASPIEHRNSPVDHFIGNEDVILEDYDCLRRSFDNVKIDGADLLMNQILSATHADLMMFSLWDVIERSRKWKNTSRRTELALIDSVIGRIDARPLLLHVFFRRLTEIDIADVFKKALLNPTAPTKYRSLFRMTFKTEMPLRQFLMQLDGLSGAIPGIQMIGGSVTGIQTMSDGSIRKFLTAEVGKLAEMEHILANGTMHLMNGSVRLQFEVDEKPHVVVGVEYHNEMEFGGRRFKTIVIEQLVTPLPGTVPGRRVTFGPEELYEVVEFEIPENAPYHPLRYSHKIFDLIEHLEKANEGFKNVTCR